MVLNKNMAFALSTLDNGEKFYIHKEYGRSDNSPSVSRNMNFALLFLVESDAKRFKKRNSLLEFNTEFVPLQVIVDERKSYQKIYYTRLKDKRNALEEDLPDFLK